jgi:hypothetical protein
MECKTLPVFQGHPKTVIQKLLTVLCLWKCNVDAQLLQMQIKI